MSLTSPSFLKWLIFEPAQEQERSVIRITMCEVDCERVLIEDRRSIQAPESPAWRPNYKGISQGADVWSSNLVQKDHALIEYDDGVKKTACLQVSRIHLGENCADPVCVVKFVLDE